MNWPIWKDYTIDLSSHLGTGIFVDYTLKDGDTVIYNGRCYAVGGVCRTTINEICADYIGAALPTLNNAAFSAQTWKRTITVHVGASLIDTVTFINDWSYDYSRNLDTAVVSDPIRPEFIDGAPVLVSVDGSQASVTGMVDDVTVSIATGGNAGVACVIPVSARTLTLGGITFVKACANAVLYYVNAWGGWDSLVMRSAVGKTDAVNRRAYGTSYQNTAPANRGRVDYRNELTRTYILRTGTLTDAQSLKMHHLLESPLVYLWMDGYMLPVIIAGDCEYKTFHNQGHKRVDYIITATLAANRERR